MSDNIIKKIVEAYGCTTNEAYDKMRGMDFLEYANLLEAPIPSPSQVPPGTPPQQPGANNTKTQGTKSTTGTKTPVVPAIPTPVTSTTPTQSDYAGDGRLKKGMNAKAKSSFGGEISGKISGYNQATGEVTIDTSSGKKTVKATDLVGNKPGVVNQTSNSTASAIKDLMTNFKQGMSTGQDLQSGGLGSAAEKIIDKMAKGQPNQQKFTYTESDDELARLKTLAGIVETSSGGASCAGGIAVAVKPIGQLAKRTKEDICDTDIEGGNTIVGDTAHTATDELGAVRRKQTRSPTHYNNVKTNYWLD